MNRDCQFCCILTVNTAVHGVRLSRPMWKTKLACLADVPTVCKTPIHAISRGETPINSGRVVQLSYTMVSHSSQQRVPTGPFGRLRRCLACQPGVTKKETILTYIRTAVVYLITSKEITRVVRYHTPVMSVTHPLVYILESFSRKTKGGTHSDNGGSVEMSSGHCH